MGSNWRNFLEYDLVIILSFELIGKSVVGLTDLYELLVCSLIVRIVLRMILQGELSIGILNLIKTCTFGNPQSSVVAGERIREVLVEELLLSLVNHPMLIEKLPEG